jgi:hypothetical protein
MGLILRPPDGRRDVWLLNSWRMYSSSIWNIMCTRAEAGLFSKTLFITFFQKAVPIFRHILAAPLYDVAISRAASFCPVQKVCGCSFSYSCTRSLTSSSTLNFFSSCGLFEWTEQVKIAWHQVRTVGGVWQYLLMHFLQRFCCHTCGVQLDFHWRRQTLSTDRLRHFDRQADFIYYVFKKLRIISCVDASLFRYKVEE